MSLQSYIQTYQESHTNPVNRVLHSIGIPMIVVSLVLVPFYWRWALALFILGWILQFTGHWFEGKPPAFLKSPAYLLVGPIWVVRKIFPHKKSSEAPH